MSRVRDAGKEAAASRPPVPASSWQIRRWDTSNGEVATVELQDYGGRRVIAMRRWYRDGAGDLRPGKNGISFPVADLDDIEKAVEVLRSLIPRPGAATEEAEPDDVVEAPEDEPAVTEAPAPHRPVMSPFPRLRVAASPPARPPVRQPPGPPASPEMPQMAAPFRQPSAPPPRPPAQVEGDAPAAPRSGNVTLVAIFAKGLVASPLALKIQVRSGNITGAAYADGTVTFGNRRFSGPHQAVQVLKNMPNVVDAWQLIRYRNPKTNRFARLSRLRNLFMGLSESDGGEGD